MYFIFFNFTYKNDLHVLKLLKNVQSEPKLNSFYYLDKNNIFYLLNLSYFICLMQYLLSLLYV